MATATMEEVGFRPMVGTALMGQGHVVEHRRIIDCMGRFHGLLRLVIENAGAVPDVEMWQQMLLKGAVVKAVMPDETISGRIIILYKFEEQ